MPLERPHEIFDRPVGLSQDRFQYACAKIAAVHRHDHEQVPALELEMTSGLPNRGKALAL